MSNLRICMGNHESVTGWQKLFFLYKCLQLSAAVAVATFETNGWKSSGYLGNFDMLFTLVLTKFSKSELFSCLPKVDHVIKSWKEPIHVHVPCTCVLPNMMAHVTTFGIVLHNIIMIANVRICTRIRVILRLKKIIIRNPPSVLMHEEAVSHFNGVHCLPLPVTSLFPVFSHS